MWCFGAEELGQQRRKGSVEHGRAQGEAGRVAGEMGELAFGGAEDWRSWSTSAGGGFVAQNSKSHEGHQCREIAPEEAGEGTGGPEGGLRRRRQVERVVG